jgi:hypothetical protein
VLLDSKDIAPERSTREAVGNRERSYPVIKRLRRILRKNRDGHHIERKDGNRILVSKRVSVLLLGSWIS